MGGDWREWTSKGVRIVPTAPLWKSSTPTTNVGTSTGTFLPLSGGGGMGGGGAHGRADGPVLDQLAGGLDAGAEEGVGRAADANAGAISGVEDRLAVGA